MSLMPGRFAWIILGVALIASCRTTNKQRPNGPIAPPDKGQTSELSLVESGKYLSLSKDEGQALYLKMLAIEMDAGAKVAPEKQHSIRGVVECSQMGIVQNCLLRVALAGDEAAPVQPLDAKLTGKALTFVLDSRPDLKDEGIVFTDLICDYVGKKSPPFNVEDVRCYFDQPRLPNEAIFDGKLAQELGEAIRGDTTYGTNLVQLNGALICQWVEASRRSICVTRTNINGVLQESLVELGAAASAAAARGLRQAAIDQSHRGSLLKSNEKSAETRSRIPNELMGSLACIVDNTRIELEGQRTYLCRAKI